MSITNPANCEVLLVLQFLKAKNICPAKIYHQHVKLYGEVVMNEENVQKCYLFNGERADAQNEV
jgi:hypothetical protein